MVFQKSILCCSSGQTPMLRSVSIRRYCLVTDSWKEKNPERDLSWGSTLCQSTPSRASEPLPAGVGSRNLTKLVHISRNLSRVKLTSETSATQPSGGEKVGLRPQLVSAHPKLGGRAATYPTISRLSGHRLPGRLQRNWPSTCRRGRLHVRRPDPTP